MKIHHLWFMLAILVAPVLNAISPNDSDDSLKKEIKDQISETDKAVIAALKVGVSTRADLMNLFTNSGGLRVPAEGSFRYRRCDSVGVDVTFYCETDGESGGDVIKTISKPYWQPVFPQD